MATENDAHVVRRVKTNNESGVARPYGLKMRARVVRGLPSRPLAIVNLCTKWERKGREAHATKETDVNLRKRGREIKEHVRYEMRELTV